jgi:hypothetical protein
MSRTAIILLLFGLAHFVAAFVSRHNRIALRNYLIVASILTLSALVLLMRYLLP